MVLAALVLSASLASAADTVQLLGPVVVTAARPHGNFPVVVTLYDQVENGRALWRGPPFSTWGARFQWTFTGAIGPASDAPLRDFPTRVFAEFRSGDMLLRPSKLQGSRQPFRLTTGSTEERLVFEPGEVDLHSRVMNPAQPAATGQPDKATRTRARALALEAARRDPARSPDPVKPAAPSAPAEPDGEAVDTGPAMRPALLDRYHAASPPAPPAGSTAPVTGRIEVHSGAPRTPTLDDLKLSNSLYFQALRDFQTGNMGLAVRKLDVALSLNPANSDARLALERILQEASPAAQASAAPRSPEAATQAQDLYFQALREYAKGRVQRSRDALIRASQLDPTDRGIAAALLHLRRELALVPSDGIH